MQPSIKDLIQPEYLQTEKSYFDTFGHYETEVSGRLIVRYLACRSDGWAPFTRQELDEFYPEQNGFHFNRLTTGNHPDVVQVGDVFTVQNSFVAKVAKWVKGDQASA